MKISKENPTVLTPDGVTSAVWGPIYGFLFITAVRQLWPRAIIKQNTRNWLSLAFVHDHVWLELDLEERHCGSKNGSFS